jgi:autotransporter-associated beta strand protein
MMLNNAGTTTVGANNGIATTAIVTLGASAAGALDLNGFNQSLMGVTRSGASAATITNSSTTSDSTLTTTGISTFAGVIADSGTTKINLTVNGGSFTLTGANTFSGTTTVRAGTLVLSNDLAINLSSGLSLAAGASLNTVALTVPPPGNIPLTASGAGTGVGTTAAAIIGVSGNPHDLGSRPLILNFDGSNPALYLAGGTLNLNNNPFTINGSVLTDGVYTIIAQSDAPDITGSVALSTVNGTALTGRTGTVSLSGNTVLLTVSGGGLPQPTIAPVSVSGTNLVLTIPSISGYNYVLQSATNMTPTINWQYESTNAGNGGNLILNVPIDPAKPQKFLRFWVY